MSSQELLAQEFGTLSDLVRAHAGERPDTVALVHGERRLAYGDLDRLVDRVAAALQRDGVRPGDTVAIAATSSIEYVAAFLGALRAGAAAAPLAPSSSPESLRAMLADCSAKLLFLDAAVAATLAGDPRIQRVALEGEPFAAWLAPPGATPAPVTIAPEAPFNLIYSSGTTGVPKGIVQSHRMRWSHVSRGAAFGYGPDTVTLLSTPLYSNTTLVSLLPTLAGGGTAVLMEKFDVVKFLALAERHRATHTMLVPVQYKRLMEHPDFDRYDLSSFRMKFSTSAPFAAALKADVLRRWPGGLIEYYGLTEGGGTCALVAHEFPHKLHTVGRPLEGHEVRVIDEEGRELPPGHTGEAVGRSPAMMNGYHNQPGKTAELEWRDASGNRFLRSGDIGRFDADGFFVLVDRKKDMIISGGFNVYPSDLEAVLVGHDAVAEAAVVGVASERWGETPVAFVVLKPGFAVTADELKSWANERVGKTQRLADLRVVAQLPRSAIGKVLKRELREQYGASAIA
jgi:acyl-CoA synthetase (AMP-forming)/AMP-acid ligase II